MSRNIPHAAIHPSIRHPPLIRDQTTESEGPGWNLLNPLPSNTLSLILRHSQLFPGQKRYRTHPAGFGLASGEPLIRITSADSFWCGAVFLRGLPKLLDLQRLCPAAFLRKPLSVACIQGFVLFVTALGWATRRGSSSKSRALLLHSASWCPQNCRL